MLRSMIPLCLVLGLCGCGDDSKTQPATTREVPEAVKPVPAEKLESTAVETDDAETAEDNSKTKAGEASADTPPAQKAIAGKKKSDPDADDKQDEESDAEKATEKALADAQQAAARGDFKAEIAALEKVLENNADNLNLIILLAQRCQNAASADPDKPDYPMYVKAADYIRQCLKAEPALSEHPKFRSFAGTVFFNEARALAVEKQNDEALQALKAAIESGFKDFDQIEKKTELEALREEPGFSEFLAQAKEAIRERFQKKIDAIFAESKPFDFDFELTDIEENAIAKADFKGKVLIIDVWGTWCPPCRAEIPHFVELVKNYKEKGLEIVGLNSEGEVDDETRKAVQEFHKDNGMNYRCALIKQDTVDKIPEMEGYPTTLFFDRAGKVRARVTGLQEYDILEAIVVRLLEEKAEDAGS